MRLVQNIPIRREAKRLVIVLLLTLIYSGGAAVLDRQYERYTTDPRARKVRPDEIGAKPLPGFEGDWISEDEFREKHQNNIPSQEGTPFNFEAATEVVGHRLVAGLIFFFALTAVLIYPAFSFLASALAVTSILFGLIVLRLGVEDLVLSVVAVVVAFGIDALRRFQMKNAENDGAP